MPRRMTAWYAKLCQDAQGLRERRRGLLQVGALVTTSCSCRPTARRMPTELEWLHLLVKFKSVFWNNVEVTLRIKTLHHCIKSSLPATSLSLSLSLSVSLSLSLWFDSIKHDNAVFLAMPILEFSLSWSLPSKRRSVLLWNVSWKFNTQRLIRKRYPICQQLSHGNSPGSEVSTLVVRAVSAH